MALLKFSIKKSGNLKQSVVISINAKLIYEIQQQ